MTCAGTRFRSGGKCARRSASSQACVSASSIRVRTSGSSSRSLLPAMRASHPCGRGPGAAGRAAARMRRWSCSCNRCRCSCSSPCSAADARGRSAPACSRWPLSVPAVLVSLPEGAPPLPVFLADEALRGAFLAAQPVGVVAGGLLFHAAVSGNERAEARPATAARVFAVTLPMGAFLESVTGFAVGAVFALTALRGMGIGGAVAAALSLQALVLVPWGGLGPGTALGAALAGLPAQEVALRRRLAERGMAGAARPGDLVAFRPRRGARADAGAARATRHAGGDRGAAGPVQPLPALRGRGHPRHRTGRGLGVVASRPAARSRERRPRRRALPAADRLPAAGAALDRSARLPPLRRPSGLPADACRSGAVAGLGGAAAPPPGRRGARARGAPPRRAAGPGDAALRGVRPRAGGQRRRCRPGRSGGRGARAARTLRDRADGAALGHGHRQQCRLQRGADAGAGGARTRRQACRTRWRPASTTSPAAPGRA